MNKIANVRLKVVGVSFKNNDGTDRQAIIGAMTKNSPVILRREPDNTYDRNAVAVDSIDGQVGDIGKDYAKIIASLMDAGRVFKATVDIVDRYEGTNYLHIMINEE